MATLIKRSRTCDHDELTVEDGARTTRWVFPPIGNSVLEIQTTHNPSQFKDIPRDKNLLIPPYHWHWYQDEYFKITKGRYVFLYEGREAIKDTSSPSTTIPHGARHTFWADPSYTGGECEVEISAASSQTSHISGPQSDTGLTEKFFRNLYSYLDDCYTQKVAPSLPQLLLMLDSAEVSLALPGPRWLMGWVSYGLGVVIGRWYGGWWCGYKPSYEEYWSEALERNWIRQLEEAKKR